MATIKINVTGEICTIAQKVTFTAGSYGVYVAEVTTDASWDDLALVLCIISAPPGYPRMPNSGRCIKRSVPVKDGEAVLDETIQPCMVCDNAILIGLLGCDADGKITRYSTVSAAGKVCSSGCVDDTILVDESRWAELISYINATIKSLIGTPTDEQVRNAIDSYAGDYGITTGATAEEAAQIAANAAAVTDLKSDLEPVKNIIKNNSDSILVSKSFTKTQYKRWNIIDNVAVEESSSFAVYNAKIDVSSNVSFKISGLKYILNMPLYIVTDSNYNVLLSYIQQSWSLVTTDEIKLPKSSKYLLLNIDYTLIDNDILQLGDMDSSTVLAKKEYVDNSICGLNAKVKSMNLPRNRKVPLLLNMFVDYNIMTRNMPGTWTAEEPRFQKTYTDDLNNYGSPIVYGKNVEFAVKGTAGSDYVTVIDGGNANIDDINTYDKIMGMALSDDYGNVSKVFAKFDSGNNIKVFPPLSNDITSGLLGNITANDIHLTELGYKAYATYAYNMNPKHCEKTRIIASFRPEKNDNIPFRGLDGRIPQIIAETHTNTRYTDRAISMKNVYPEVIEKSGLCWEQDVNMKNGYLEIYVGDALKDEIPNMENSDDFLYLDFYLDDVLVESRVKKTTLITRECFDFSNAMKAKIVIYKNNIAYKHGFNVSNTTWWENTVEWGDKLFPNNIEVIQCFDSWGTFNNSACIKEISRLINMNSNGLTIPFYKKSAGNMTSEWGKNQIYPYDGQKMPSISEYVQKGGRIVIIDFLINDFNTGVGNVKHDNDLELYIANMLTICDWCISHDVQPIIFGCQQYGSYYLWYNELVDAIADHY